MKIAGKILGALGLVVWIACLSILKQEFGNVAWLLGLGCGAGMGFTRLLA